MNSFKKKIILSLIICFLTEILGFGGNTLLKASITNNIISQSIKNTLTDDSKNIIDTINQYIADDSKIALIQIDTQLTNALNGLTNFDALYLQYILQNTADIAGANGEFTGDLRLYALINSGKGYAYTDAYGNIIGINTLKTDLANSADTINVLFHETTNYADHTQNEQTAVNRGDTAQAIWELKNFEKENTNTQTTQDWNDQNYNSPVILYGNLLYDNANKNNINNWFTPDTFADIGFISYDLYKILIDNIIDNNPNLKENIIALGADTAGLFIPLATGLGTATKTANKVDDVIDVTAKADEVVEGVVKYGDEAGKGQIKNIFNSIKNAPNYPEGFKPKLGGLTKNSVKNKKLQDGLQKIETGKWNKVYKDGYDKMGNKISIHYFESKSGKVFDVQVKQNWSN